MEYNLQFVYSNIEFERERFASKFLQEDPSLSPCVCWN